MTKEFIIKNINDFNLTHVFECGQCFRWNKQEDGSYIGVFKNNVIKVKQSNKDIVFTGECDGDISIICTDYFDLNNDYNAIKNTLSKIDSNMKSSINYGYGIRILHQDIWETLISFIISANNNIPRIKSIIEKMSAKYGKELIFENKKYYTFPTPEELKNSKISDFRALGMGFRDKRIYETVHKVLDQGINLNELGKRPTPEVRDILLEFPGVGPKVADCIMLFSMKKYDAFPIDVWVRRVMNELYIKNQDETKVSKKELEKLAQEKYGDLAGLAQQYLFYWRREKGA